MAGRKDLIKVNVSDTILSSPRETFAWFLCLENFASSPLIISSKWRQKNRGEGAIRGFLTLHGWYEEKILEIKRERLIRLQVLDSFPKMKARSEIAFTEPMEGFTRVTWAWELMVPAAEIPFLGNLVKDWVIKQVSHYCRAILISCRKGREAGARNTGKQ